MACIHRTTAAGRTGTAPHRARSKQKPSILCTHSETVPTVGTTLTKLCNAQHASIQLSCLEAWSNHKNGRFQHLLGAIWLACRCTLHHFKASGVASPFYHRHPLRFGPITTWWKCQLCHRHHLRISISFIRVKTYSKRIKSNEDLISSWRTNDCCTTTEKFGRRWSANISSHCQTWTEDVDSCCSNTR